MFSLKSLLLIVALAALGTAGLIYRTQAWTSAIIALTLVLVAFAICRAMFVPKERAFWGSFAVFGAMYLTIVSLESLSALHFNLPTTQLITYALEKFQKPTQIQAPSTGTGPAVGMSVMYSREVLFKKATEDRWVEGFAAEARFFLWAAQCLWCLLLAFAAGVTCSWLFRPAPPMSENANGGTRLSNARISAPTGADSPAKLLQ